MKRSVADRPLLRRVDLLSRLRLEEVRVAVLREELSRLRVHEVEAVVVDQHRLLLQPVAPALLADLGDDALAGGAADADGWLLESRAGLAAARAGDVGHENPGRGVRDAGPAAPMRRAASHPLQPSMSKGT